MFSPSSFDKIQQKLSNSTFMGGNSLPIQVSSSSPLTTASANVPALQRLQTNIHFPYTSVSKNVPLMACYNFDIHKRISIIFGRDVTSKVGNQKKHYYATSNNLSLCTSWQNAKTQKSNFSLKCCISRKCCSSWTVLHTQRSSWKKNCHL